VVAAPKRIVAVPEIPGAGSGNIVTPVVVAATDPQVLAAVSVYMPDTEALVIAAGLRSVEE
jgi:hypothetical protein